MPAPPPTPLSAKRSVLATALLPAILALLTAPAGATVIPVTTLVDQDAADGDCSLREALIAANTDTAYRECAQGDGSDEIVLTPAGGVVLLDDLPMIEEGVTVRGLGPAMSVIDAGGLFELFRFLDGPGGTSELLRLEGLTVTGGIAGDGGAVYLGRNRRLEVEDCHFLDNHATVEGGAIRGRLCLSVSIAESWFDGNLADVAGGGVAVWGCSLEIADSTFSDNHALGGNGGGFYSLLADPFSIARSTLVGNSTVAAGGGAAIVGSVPVLCDSLTVIANTADSDDVDDGSGGGLSFTGGGTVATLINSVVAGNVDATTGGTVCPDLTRSLGANVVSAGFNLVGANDCMEAAFPAGSPNVNADHVGTSAMPIPAELEPLDFIGGPTPTMRPLPTSLAIDQGTCPGALADQRGFSDLDGERPVDDPAVADASDGCDIGSVERGAIPAIFADGFETGDSTRWSVVLP